MIRIAFIPFHFTVSFHPVSIIFAIVILARITQYLWILSTWQNNAQVTLTSVLSAHPASCYFSNSMFYWKLPDCELEEIGSIYRVIGRVAPASDDGIFSKKRLIVEDIHYFEKMSSSDDDWLLTVSSQIARFRATAHTRVLSALRPEPGGLVLSLVLGTQDYLSPAIRRSFETTGTLHILAVSGLHVSLFMGVVQASVAPFTSGRRKAMLVWLVSFLYVLLVGLKPSILRAWGMMSFALLARQWLYRQYSPLRLLWIVAGLLVVVRPDWFFHPGMQLSVAATCSILLLATRLQRLATLIDLFPDLQGGGAYGERIVRKSWVTRALDPLYGSFAVSVAAHLATFPLVLHHFGTAPLLSFIPSSLATLAGGYLLTWLFLVTPVLLLSSGLPWIESLLAAPIELSVQFFIQLLRALSFYEWQVISVVDSP